MAQDKSPASTAQGKSPTSDELQAQLTTLRQEIGSITETLTAMAKTQKEGLADAAHRGYEQVRDRGADAISSAQQKATELNDQAHEFVHEKPGLALGIAAALGFAVGVLATSRR